MLPYVKSTQVHVVQTINLEMYKDYGTCTVVWLHIIIGLVQITCISRNFIKLMQAENHFFLSNTCMFYAR